MAHTNGYLSHADHDHPNVMGNGQVFDHVAVAVRALGKPLPKGVEVHHVNGVRSDNRGCNLVICQDHAYHSLLHQRARSLAACGHPSWKRCWICDRYDDPRNFNCAHVHQECSNHRTRESRARLKAGIRLPKGPRKWRELREREL